MRYKPLFIITILLFYSWTLHPVHLSVINMTLSEDGQKLEYSVRLFQDDLIVLLNILNHEAMHNNSILDSNAINNYIQKTFLLTADSTQLSSVLIKKETNEMEYWLFFETILPANTSNLHIENSILTEVFQEQQNLVIFSYKNKEKGLTFGRNNYKHLLQLETI